MIDISQYVTEEDRPDRSFPTFAVRPTQMYPAMVSYIAEILKVGPVPDRYLDTKGTPNPVVMYYDEVKALPDDALELALVPYDSAKQLSQEKRQARNAALECARKWFTELLHQSISGKPMGVHILAEDSSFRLC